MSTNTKVNVSLDLKACVRLQTTTANRLAGQAAQEVQARARRFAPKRTGALALSIETVKVLDGEIVVYKIRSPLEYAEYQEFGTGPIFAKPGGVLRFKVGGMIIFARHTKGVPATHFMRRAADHITISDFIL